MPGGSSHQDTETGYQWSRQEDQPGYEWKNTRAREEEARALEMIVDKGSQIKSSEVRRSAGFECGSEGEALREMELKGGYSRVGKQADIWVRRSDGHGTSELEQVMMDRREAPDTASGDSLKGCDLYEAYEMPLSSTRSVTGRA
ncbi:hypothetical protein N0V83_006940 [Neocucurbitaria cava]|uniref:Uncharacterized protein n=1 Tax=Neocucurbitaria cava TaxID=798079 RepID=A0A9W8Y770_9PLEO|nr:hypothetical protein N0V83_006940 [Neocucurbitaria cava]